MHVFCRRIKYIGPSAISHAESALHLRPSHDAAAAFARDGFAAAPRRIVVYAPQANYQVDILVRDGVDYVGLTDLLEPLGRLESRIEGKNLILVFNGNAAQFQDGKRQYRTRSNNKLELASNFLLVDGRGYVPMASITQLLSNITSQNAEFHAAARRLFLGPTQFHYSAELRHAPSRLVLSFPTPVNPSTVVEKSRVHLLFRREPVVGNGTDNVAYGDPFLPVPASRRFRGRGVHRQHSSACHGFHQRWRTYRNHCCGAAAAVVAAPAPGTAASQAGQPGPSRTSRTTLTALCDSGCGPWRI